MSSCSWKPKICVKYWQFVTGGHMVLIDLLVAFVWHGVVLASFPGLPFLFFGFSPALPLLPCIILNYTEWNRRTKKRGRPGNEASVVLDFPCGLCCSFVCCLTDDYVWQSPHSDSAGCTSQLMLTYQNNHLTTLLWSLLWINDLFLFWVHSALPQKIE